MIVQNFTLSRFTVTQNMQVFLDKPQIILLYEVFWLKMCVWDTILYLFQLNEAFNKYCYEIFFSTVNMDINDFRGLIML